MRTLRGEVVRDDPGSLDTPKTAKPARDVSSRSRAATAGAIVDPLRVGLTSRGRAKPSHPPVGWAGNWLYPGPNCSLAVRYAAIHGWLEGHLEGEECEADCVRHPRWKDRGHPEGPSLN
jgi:hypothetical protein